MVDREKVVKGLERIRDYDPMFRVTHDDEFSQYAADALALLKAQEPVEPVPGLWDRDIQLYKCGACGGEIGAGGIAKYCFHCGKAVKWE